MALDLTTQVQKVLKDYSEDITDSAKEVIPKVAKDAAKKLRSDSPKHTGKYAKGWTSKVEKSRLSVTATVHGKTGTYQLAHLLEHGHANRGGGRTRGIVHIAPVEEWAIKEVETKLNEAIKK